MHIGVVGACYYSKRLPNTEHTLDGKRVDAETVCAVASVASDEVDPTSDFHASAEYRKALVATLVERALLAAAKRTN